MKDMIMSGLFPLVCAFAVVALIGPAFIPWLRRLKFGQEIREEGPSWHQKKSGTPTMGGIMFIVGIAAAVAGTFLIALFSDNMTVTMQKSLVVLVTAVLFGAVGFIDDFIKVVKKRNLGLKALPKFLLQIIITAAYIITLGLIGELRTEILIPFTHIAVKLPMVVYIIFMLFVVTGTVNAVNLTDGLDGLATCVTAPVALFFALCAFSRGDLGVFTFGVAVFGGLLGFFIYNKYPAKVFMGDTGSLFLGGAVAAMAIALEMQLYLIVVGFVFFFEALSVILQVASFKLTGKRIFKMSPIHHHFEMCGWKEVKIVAVFTAVTVILCAASYVVITAF